MTSLKNEKMCPACGYELGFEPWKDGNPSDEICPCCGIQFGYDDAAGGAPDKREKVYIDWRQHWVDAGMKWYSKLRKPPQKWTPKTQVEQIIAAGKMQP